MNRKPMDISSRHFIPNEHCQTLNSYFIKDLTTRGYSASSYELESFANFFGVSSINDMVYLYVHRDEDVYWDSWDGRPLTELDITKIYLELLGTYIQQYKDERFDATQDTESDSFMSLENYLEQHHLSSLDDYLRGCSGRYTKIHKKGERYGRG